jgi:magnesium chelatase subunit D
MGGVSVKGAGAGGTQLPLSAVVGQEEAKLALVLIAVDPQIGGLLLRGEKGTAKSTLARALAALLPGSAPFVELPIGATEDRVVGSIDLAAALTGGEQRFRPGLLAAADGGVLYVDEINLLPDHLVDVLLDAAASGVNRVEREGISHVHASRFLLIGSMNPEEGDLRPQLLDRFGLAVAVRTARDPAERAAAVRRRLAFDADPVRAAASTGVAAAEEDLRRRLHLARPAELPDAVVEGVASLCAAVGAEGLRADLTICRAAAALAGWEGRKAVSADDVRRVAPLALAHRARRDPLEPAGMDEERLKEALDKHVGRGDQAGVGGALAPADGPGPFARAVPPDDVSPPPGGPGGPGRLATASPGDDAFPRAGGPGPPAPDVPPDDAFPPPGAQLGPDSDGDGDPGQQTWADRRQQDPVEPGPPGPALSISTGVRARHQGSPATGRRAPVEAKRGRLVGDRTPDGPPASVAAGATLRQAAARHATAGATPTAPLSVRPEDVREAVRVDRTANLIVLAVDASGSMGAPQRMEAAKGAVLGLLTDAYQRRDLVGLVAFGGDEARILLRPTGSVEVARARLVALPTGGRTPLAAGITTALQLVTAPTRAHTHRPVLVLVTDGRATSGPAGADPVTAAGSAADAVRRAGVEAIVIDVESTPGPAGVPLAPGLGLARELAARMGGRHVPLPALTPDGLRHVVREQFLLG